LVRLAAAAAYPDGLGRGQLRRALLLQADAWPADLVSRQKHDASALQRLSNRIDI
jgi:hypothetical protein